MGLGFERAPERLAEVEGVLRLGPVLRRKVRASALDGCIPRAPGRSGGGGIGREPLTSGANIPICCDLITRSLISSRETMFSFITLIKAKFS